MASKIGSERLTCPKNHVLPLLGCVLKLFNLDQSNVLAIYVVGSHLWMTCQTSSDFDLVIIVKKLSSLKPLNHHKGNIEAFIIPEDQYIEQLSDHSLQLLITLWIPKIFILKEEFNPRAYFCLSNDSLVSAIQKHKERDFRIAQKHFVKSDKIKAKKILLHFIRYMVLAIQIKNVDKITDYSAANVYRDQVLGNCSSDWHELLITIVPIVDNLWSSLIS